MPKFFTGQHLPGNIAFVRIEDDGTTSIMRKDGGGMSLTSNQAVLFQDTPSFKALQEITQEEAERLFKAESPRRPRDIPERIIDGVVTQVRSFTPNAPPSIASDDTIETLVDVIDSAVQRGEFAQKTDIRRAIRRVLKPDPQPPTP